MSKRLLCIIFLLIFFTGITNEASSRTQRTSNSLVKFKQSKDILLKRNIKISKAINIFELLIKQAVPGRFTPLQRLQWIKQTKWLKSVHLRLKKHLLRSKQLSRQIKASSADNRFGLFANKMKKMNKEFSLFYIQLKQDIQNENRQFTLVSNIMKVRRDVSKNAINNVR